MNPTILQIPRRLRHKDIHLLLLPPQSPRQQRQTKRLQPFGDVDLIPPSQLFHIRVLGPRVGRPHEHFHLDVDEARGLHVGREILRGVAAEWTAEFERGLAEELAPFVDGGAEVGVVGGAHGEAVVLQFEPTAGLEVSVGGREMSVG